MSLSPLTPTTLLPPVPVHAQMGGIDYLRLDKTKDKAYAFDRAFDESVVQEVVFRHTTAPIIRSVLAGCNATCFACVRA